MHHTNTVRPLLTVGATLANVGILLAKPAGGAFLWFRWSKRTTFGAKRTRFTYDDWVSGRRNSEVSTGSRHTFRVCRDPLR